MPHAMLGCTSLAIHDSEFVIMQVKCWQIRRLSKAPQAAGTIHTDFEKGFICAEVNTGLSPCFHIHNHISENLMFFFRKSSINQQL